jgi:hypothetical protein
MVLFVCLDCGHLFEHPQKVQEKHGLEDGPFEEFYACPVCSGAYVTAPICDGCDEYITDDYLQTKDGSIWCQDCCMARNIGDEH